MKVQTRDRIVGGVFLVSLLAIFLPMLFDDAKGPALEVEPMADLEIEPVANIPLADARTAIEKREEMREIVDEDGFLVESGTRVGDVELETASDDNEYWAVQLASFSDKTKADALRDRLNNDGQPTWVSQAKINDVVVTRVAIGPFDQREEAYQARGELSEKYELDAVVVNFNP